MKAPLKQAERVPLVVGGHSLDAGESESESHSGRALKSR